MDCRFFILLVSISTTYGFHERWLQNGWQYGSRAWFNYYRQPKPSNYPIIQPPSPTTTTTTTTATTTTTTTTTTPEPTTENTMDLRTTAILSSARKSDILKKCSNIRDENLAEVCRRVAKNPILQAMEKNGNGTRGLLGLEELALGRKLFVPSQIKCDATIACPGYKRGNGKRTDKNLLSLSPWVMCTEFDALR